MKRGGAVIERNFRAIDSALATLHRVDLPAMVSGDRSVGITIPDDAPDSHQVTGDVAGEGDRLPVTTLPATTGTANEKRAIAAEIPIWDPDICIDCGKCAVVPHASIRMKVFLPEAVGELPRSCPPSRSARRTSRATAWSSRWRPTTAPAVACASTCARPRARPRCAQGDRHGARAGPIATWSAVGSTSWPSHRSTAASADEQRQGLRGARAAVRVLGPVRGLRRVAT